MLNIDVAIIGAGVVGLAAAAELGADGVFLFEKRERHGMETSSRNSEVIHSGIYYAEGSLKARHCVRGAAMMYETCARRGIAHTRVGKIIVGAEEQLNELLRRGQANGVEGLEIIDRARIAELEPNVAGDLALHSPNTGMVDSEGLMRMLLRDARDRGAQPIFNTELIAIEPASGGGFILRFRDATEQYQARCRVVINAAGHGSDRVAAMAGIDIDAREWRIRLSKGSYFAVTNNRRALANGLVYPAPGNYRTLGIHATPCVEPHSTSLRFGPDDEPVDRVEYSVDESKHVRFLESAQELFPQLEPRDLHPDTAGVSPRLSRPGERARDFVISAEADMPGLVNLVGIDSPGLTSSLSIANDLRTMLDEVF